MKAFLSSSLFLAVLFAVIASNVNSQDMKKPDPIKNAAFDMLMGNWVAEPYEMMGSKMNETANHYIKYGQFMFVDIVGTDEKGGSWNGTVIMKPNTDGTYSGWSFDDWGQVGTYTAVANGNKITVNGKTDWGTETREIEINGNKMVHNLTMTMKGPDGKDMTMKTTITYNKK